MNDGYRSDHTNPSIYESRVHYSTLSNGSYVPSQEIPGPADFTGYGDSNAVVAGSSDFAAAAWVRMNTDLPGKDAGSPVSKAEQTLLLNGTEIVVSVYDGTGWTSTRRPTTPVPTWLRR